MSSAKFSAPLAVSRHSVYTCHVTENSPIIETFSLRKEFGDAAAVDGVSLTVPRGSVFALVGPNGAGKSTLLKMVAALLEPTRGHAVVDGANTTENPREVHSRIGFLPDFFGLYEELTAEEYLDYFGMAYRLGENERRRRVHDVLEMVGLFPILSKTVETLSRGMRQRLAIARTLIHNPSVLLLDEPASGLDPDARNDLQNLFKSLSKEGKTLIVSSHILSELEDYCTHVAILQKGTLVASGAVDEVRRGMGTGRRVRARSAGKNEALCSFLKESPHVALCRADGEECIFDFSGDENQLAELLQKIVSARIPVVHFGEEKGTIQETYLSLMEKERHD